MECWEKTTNMKAIGEKNAWKVQSGLQECGNQRKTNMIRPSQNFLLYIRNIIKMFK